MIPELVQSAGGIVKNHWAGGLSGGALVHFAHIAWPWLKANNGLRGAFEVIIGTKPTPIVKTNVTVISPSAPSETIQPK